MKDVVYFPKGSNIVDAQMIKDLEVGENLVRFKLVLDDVDDEKNQFLFESAKKILNDNFGDIDVNKPGIVAKLNSDGKGDKPECHTFLDDIVGAIAAAASTRVAQIMSEEMAHKE